MVVNSCFEDLEGRVLGSEGPEFKSCSAVELIPGVVDSVCHPSEVGKISTSVLVGAQLV